MLLLDLFPIPRLEELDFILFFSLFDSTSGFLKEVEKDFEE